MASSCLHKKRKKSEKNESNVSGMVSTSLSLETTNEYLSVMLQAKL